MHALALPCPALPCPSPLQNWGGGLYATSTAGLAAALPADRKSSDGGGGGGVGGGGPLLGDSNVDVQLAALLGQALGYTPGE